jgi:hypothetical protein
MPKRAGVLQWCWLKIYLEGSWNQWSDNAKLWRRWGWNYYVSVSFFPSQNFLWFVLFSLIVSYSEWKGIQQLTHVAEDGTLCIGNSFQYDANITESWIWHLLFSISLSLFKFVLLNPTYVKECLFLFLFFFFLNSSLSWFCPTSVRNERQWNSILPV